MKKCTATDKINVLIATYNPDLKWFKELLLSVNNQTYGNYDVIIYDDASSTVDEQQLYAFIKENLKDVSFTFRRGKENIGSNGAFQKLIEYADAEYVAFCDQDDIWHENKLEKCYTSLKNSGKTLICSDVAVIDGNGKKIADSITKVRKRHNFYPTDLLKYLTYKNFVIGCTVLMGTADAKKCIPFTKNTVHDQQLAIYSALHNGIEVINEPLIDYRIHGNNQTGVLCKVIDRKSYFDWRIELFYSRIKELKERYNYKELFVAEEWAKARISNYNKEKGSFKRLYSLKNVNKSTTYFELVALRNKLIFKLALKLIKKGVL